MTQISILQDETVFLQHLRQRMGDRGDAANAGKTDQLLDKLDGGRCALAFCGHFSAGKSSLINALCGAPILPSGPVPTSANLVRIANGDPAAEVVLKPAHPSGASAKHAVKQVPFDELWTYGVNGEEVERIQIRYPVPILAGRLELLDTPGVDSTDEGHKAATEAALHLADAVMYVTDYNHVLSEMNFAFLKRLQEWEKPIYLIINQIDKHDERELAFADFRRQLRETLASWGIVPGGILFLSVKKPDHPLSEWGRLLWLIERLGEQADELLRQSVLHSAAFLARAHVDLLYPSAEEGEEKDRQPAEGQNGEEGPNGGGAGENETGAAGETGKTGEAREAGKTETLTEIEQACARIAAELEEIRRLPEREREAFRAEAVKLIENAILMPAPLRDDAERYLESRKPGFKAGLFASRARTARETEDRLKRLADRFQERVEKQLEWFLNEMLVNLARQAGMTEEAISAGLPPVAVRPAPEWIAAQVNPAAGFTREYTMTYTSLLSDRVKAEARKQALERFDNIAAHLARAAEAEAAKRERELAELMQRAQRLRGEEERAREKREYAEQLLAGLASLLKERRFPDPADAPEEELRDGGRLPAAPESAASRPRDADAIAAFASASSAEPKAARNTPNWQKDAEGTAERMEIAAAALAGIPSGEPLRQALTEKARQLRQRRFTVALFGAFSAGKSSLANALIGDRVLPVSPNPTTAAINTIMPPEADWPHQTARVRMKTEEAVLDDIRFSLSMLGADSEGLATMEAALAAISGLDEHKIPARGKTHYSFLRAVLAGWPEVAGKLGSEWRADAAEYREFVANEHKSCFVERIDLYCQSPLAERGVVLVDTPGADSIHARHTGVAFDYIKNADALLYVTYYNHAFSQADKQFLAQLGRVKDSFELDKMFFIVNAADLADSAEELRGVLRYVEEELNRQGIRRARLFPVSSRMALQGKAAGDGAALERSGLPAFEAAFAAFAAGELLQTALRSGEAEIERAAAELRRLIALARQGERELREQAAARREAAKQLIRMLEDGLQGLTTDALRQEIRELLHYAKQRCMYRFGEWYNDAFHPSALRDDAGNKAAALNAAWRRLLQSAAVEISQETWAASLRTERFIQEQFRRVADGWRQAAAEGLPGFDAHLPLERKFPAPEVNEALGPVEPQEKTMRRWFKNAKSFFEGGGKEGLREELEQTVAAALQRYADEHEARLAGHYEPLFAEGLKDLFARFQSQLDLYLSGYDQGTEGASVLRDAAELEERLARIARSAAGFS